jgi:hypothetical protein
MRWNSLTNNTELDSMSKGARKALEGFDATSTHLTGKPVGK